VIPYGSNLSPLNLFFIGLQSIRVIAINMPLDGLQREEKQTEPSRFRLSFRGFPSPKSETELRLDAADLSRIPSSGPVVVMANLQWGLLYGSPLVKLFGRVRSDIKVIAYPARYAFLNPRRNRIEPESLDHRAAEVEALSWLRKGGLLAVSFGPEMFHWQFVKPERADPDWNELPVRLIRQTQAAALPIYICGQNPAVDFFASFHPRFENGSAPEFRWQEKRQVEVRVGSEIPAESVVGIADDTEAAEYLRWRTHLLARRSRSATSWPVAIRSRIAAKVQPPVAAPEPAELLSAELERLSEKRRLVESAELAAYLADADEMPNLMQELGRLREFTFRRAGEGTGKTRDLDRYDRYYSHILLWNKPKQELVGAYRAGNTADILANLGVKGLYTSTLFRYGARFFEKLGPALELGRSFVRPEYQRQYAPLLLLWKAIARLLAMQPEIAVVFGPVSISNDYSKASREMIYRFFEARMQEDELAGLIAPRKPFRPGGLRPWDCRAMCHALRDLEDLSPPITDVESDGKGLPILLRQYAKIGGKLLGFNLDRKFSNVLDGLMVVDLRKTEPAVLERYMGREAAAQFRRKHAPYS
jgi:putative hemolysin